MRPVLLIAVAACLVLAGCGGGDDQAPAETSSARVYFLLDGKVWPVARELGDEGGIGLQALTALGKGPTKQERADLGLTSEARSVDWSLTRNDDGFSFDVGDGISDAGLAQIVYTLTQFPGHESVEIGGETYTRADFEDETPAILVETPLAYEEVTSPVRATGTANTFEATFQYELTDTDGRIVDEDFVTATSGTGTRGTFDFTTDEFTVPFDGIGSLIVFELSAKDGSRINLVEIPLQMSK